MKLLSSPSTRSTTVRSPGGLRQNLPLIGAAFLACLALNALLLIWINAGPPPGKTQSFFLELVLVLGAAVTMVVAAALHPARARAAIPFLFVILAWHTGFQISLSSDWPSVISAFDVLIPAILVIGLIGRWQTGPSAGLAEVRFWKLYGIFMMFVLWGLALGVARGVDPAAMLQNAKAFVIYPLIVPLLVWCVRSWRQFYFVTAAMLALIAQRALDGILGHASNLATNGTLIAGQLVARANGGFAATNQYALYLMSGALIMVAITVAARSWRLRVLLGLGLVAMFYALALTLSRGAFVAIGVGLVLLMILLPRKQALAVAVVSVLALFAIEVVHPDTLGIVMGRLGSFGDNSTSERLDYLGLGERVIAGYPFGAGWGAAFVKTAAGVSADHSPLTDWPWYHNDYLQLATEISLAGLATFLWLWFAMLRRGLKTVRENSRVLQRATIAGLVAAAVGMLIQAATDQIFWRSDIAPHVWIVAGLLLAAVSLSRRDQGSRQSPGLAPTESGQAHVVERAPSA